MHRAERERRKAARAINQVNQEANKTNKTNQQAMCYGPIDPTCRTLRGRLKGLPVNFLSLEELTTITGMKRERKEIELLNETYYNKSCIELWQELGQIIQDHPKQLINVNTEVCDEDNWEVNEHGARLVITTNGFEDDKQYRDRMTAYLSSALQTEDRTTKQTDTEYNTWLRLKAKFGS